MRARSSALASSLRRPVLAVLGVWAMAAAVLLPGEAEVVKDVVQPAAAAPPKIVIAPPPRPVVPVFRPETIAIEKLGVDAPIVPVGLEEDGAMGTPSNARDVAWWDGVRVGEGNALLAGHRDWNRARGSFYALQALAPGDRIVVRGEGRELTFSVEWVEQMDADVDAAELLGDVGKPVLTLITCGGVFDRSVRHYRDRVVVRAVLA